MASISTGCPVTCNRLHDDAPYWSESPSTSLSPYELGLSLDGIDTWDYGSDHRFYGADPPQSPASTTITAAFPDQEEEEEEKDRLRPKSEVRSSTKVVGKLHRFLRADRGPVKWVEHGVDQTSHDLNQLPPKLIPVPRAHGVKRGAILCDQTEGSSSSIQQVPLLYQDGKTPAGTKIRILYVQSQDQETPSVFVHAADLGGVVERKSNISRLFGQFEPGAEKVLMNVTGRHNHLVGQESNVLTKRGVLQFLQINKMRDQLVYQAWIRAHVLPLFTNQPPCQTDVPLSPKRQRMH